MCFVTASPPVDDGARVDARPQELYLGHGHLLEEAVMEDDIISGGMYQDRGAQAGLPRVPKGHRSSQPR